MWLLYSLKQITNAKILGSINLNAEISNDMTIMFVTAACMSVINLVTGTLRMFFCRIIYETGEILG